MKGEQGEERMHNSKSFSANITQFQFYILRRGKTLAHTAVSASDSDFWISDLRDGTVQEKSLGLVGLLFSKGNIRGDSGPCRQSNNFDINKFGSRRRLIRTNSCCLLETIEREETLRFGCHNSAEFFPNGCLCFLARKYSLLLTQTDLGFVIY